MSFKVRIRSRHDSHNIIRGIIKAPVRTIVRFGSITPTEAIYPKATKLGKKIIEVNSVEGVKNSSSKLLMKRCFTKNNIKTAEWVEADIVQIEDENISWEENNKKFTISFPIVAKHHFGSRGTGNYLIENKEEFNNWVKNKNLTNYIFEKFYSYSREYRLHVTKNGCFYTCRKMLKADTPQEKRWFRNDSNSIWVVKENPMFDRPVNWNKIEEECIKALEAINLDVAAFDVKVQSAFNNGKKRDNPAFIIIESNSAPSFGEITAEKYKEETPKIINLKNN